jgi:hypothetical protein
MLEHVCRNEKIGRSEPLLRRVYDVEERLLVIERVGVGEPSSEALCVSLPIA